MCGVGKPKPEVELSSLYLATFKCLADIITNWVRYVHFTDCKAQTMWLRSLIALPKCIFLFKWFALSHNNCLSNHLSQSYLKLLLRGSCHEELKKVKRLVQHAVFAAYNLSLETSFLADEGASLPIIPSSSVLITEDSGVLNEDLLNKLATRSYYSNRLKGLQESTVPSSREVPESQTQLLFGEEESQLVEAHYSAQHEIFDEDVSSVYISFAYWVFSQAAVSVSRKNRYVFPHVPCRLSFTGQ